MSVVEFNYSITAYSMLDAVVNMNMSVVEFKSEMQWLGYNLPGLSL